ncbi:dual specificity protein phosphatase family protein [Haloarcula sediminis]|uniref:dual specificity protein phosphatase family protein n=1 Tax=Haloarcula sediminis TaxID=3111777 RepID=UPI002D7A29BE|nr:dual specificity protein phosphatase [Haloarcula sp. CK38]
MDEVTDGIFVGTEADAGAESRLRTHGIDVVVSLTHSKPETGGVSRVDVPMTDGPQNSYRAFTEAVRTVLDRRDAGHCVLIHCAAGSSRSPSVAAAVITHLTDDTLNQAFNQVLDRRPETDPHDALVRQAARVAGHDRE